jgi:hypothetical protein
VLTGTPIENRLDDLYSIVSFLDPKIFGPLFRFNREFDRLDGRGRPEAYLQLQKVLSTDSGGVGLNLQNASVVINCDLPWNPAKLEQRIARAWRKHQKNAVTVINLVASDTIEERMIGTLEAKRSLADGVLDLAGDLDEVPLRPGGQTFLQRLEQTLSTATAAKAPVAKPAPADPVETFAQRAAALLGSRLVACQERFPDHASHSVLIVTVDRDADAWQPRLAELQAEMFSGADPLCPVHLEVLDRATMKALERLEAAGLIHSRVRATRHLYPNGEDAITPLTDEEKSRAADFRRQAAKKLKLAKILLAEAAERKSDRSIASWVNSLHLSVDSFCQSKRSSTASSRLRP